MGPDYTEDVETQLAQNILALLNRYHLTAPQAKSLLEKVRTLIEAGELGFFQQSH